MARNWLAGRLKRLFAGLRGVDAVMIINTGSVDPNFHYFTGFTSGLFENTVLVATRSRLYLITSPLEYQTALDQKIAGMRVVNSGYGDNVAKRWLSKLVRGKRLGINGGFMPVSLFKKFQAKYKPGKMVDVNDRLVEARQVKDADEIRKIKKAVAITKKAMKEIQKHFRSGITELQLAAQFDFMQMSMGASGPSFETIVCFGKTASEPHHSPGGTRLKKGDFILIDAGAKVENYCSDITRTFVFGGKPNKRQQEMLKLVATTQKKAIQAIKPGRDGREVYGLALSSIDGAYGGRYKGRFIHTLGHSLGLEVHDGYRLSSQSVKLREGMVFTVEPGVYIPGFGGVRMEDDIVITKNGCKVL